MTGSGEDSLTKYWNLAILGAVAVFVLLAASNIDLPGIYYDELIQVTPALHFVKGDAMNSQVPGLDNTAIHFHGHRLPLMTMGYIGAVKTIAFVPIAATLTLGPRSIRYFTIMIGAISLLAIAGFARRFIGPAAAALAIIFLATDPSFLIYCRTDYGPTVFMMALKGVALWQLIMWWQTGRSWPLYRAAFATGLGVYDKTNFLWIVMAVAGATILLEHRFFTRLNWRQMACACGFFIIGCSPLIAYNRHWPPPTLTALAAQNHSDGRETGPPHSFEEVERRLIQRTAVFGYLFTATSVVYMRDLPPPRVVIMPFAVFAASLITLVCYAIRSVRRRWRREMFLLLVTFFIVLLASLTPGAFKNHHLILAYPFPHLLVAAIVVRGVRQCCRMRAPLGAIASAAVICVCAAAPVAANVLRYRQVTVGLQKTGGTDNWSDAIYALDSWLENHDPAQPVVAVDWGIEQPLAVLSQGRLHCVDLWQVHDASDYQDFFNVPGTRYVLHAPDTTNYPEPRDIFLEGARARGLQTNLAETFNDRTGRPTLLVYVLSRMQESKPPSSPQ